jgi:hypothetical protein
MNTSALPFGRTGFETTPSGRRVSVAGATYVTAWVVGLLTAPATPSATAPDSEIHGYYLEHGPAIAFQSALIHGLAGSALVVLALTVPTAAAAVAGRRRTVITLGTAAALVSFLQVAFALVAVAGAAHHTPVTSAVLLDSINVADTVKLVLLAGFTTAVTRAAAAADMVPPWVRAMTTVLSVLLLLGGAAFLVDSPVLTALLYASLPLLLGWAATIALFVGRRAR